MPCSGTFVHSAPLDAGVPGGIRIMRGDERHHFVGRVAHRNELRPSELSSLPAGRGHELGMLALEELASEEDHRAPYLVERETVLRGVREDLLFGTGSSRRVDNPGTSNREQAGFAD